MSNNEFKLWLDGYFSLSEESYLDKNQVKIIQNHACLVGTVEPVEDNVTGFIHFLITNSNEHGQVCFEKANQYFISSVGQMLQS